MTTYRSSRLRCVRVRMREFVMCFVFSKIVLVEEVSEESQKIGLMIDLYGARCRFRRDSKGFSQPYLSPVHLTSTAA